MVHSKKNPSVDFLRSRLSQSRTGHQQWNISRATYMLHMAYLYVNDTCHNRQDSSASAQDTEHGKRLGISRYLNSVSSRYHTFQISCTYGIPRIL